MDVREDYETTDTHSSPLLRQGFTKIVKRNQIFGQAKRPRPPAVWSLGIGKETHSLADQRSENDDGE